MYHRGFLKMYLGQSPHLAQVNEYDDLVSLTPPPQAQDERVQRVDRIWHGTLPHVPAKNAKQCKFEQMCTNILFGGYNLH
ncbi:hypothetical protein TSUD_100260 [Trifolium subterraneum]|uniref:Uncharacterized protein n=1 Tax=Trifolium subterraneum TaxID=3900 RepID=A0A2Z6NKL9_TRISU|nr:hypothetical protein TSUD_100260 [Trifolium subterraneum]